MIPYEDEICWEYCRQGPVPDAHAQLRRVVGAFGRKGRWPHIKVGYTAHPRIRWWKYKQLGWQAFYPVYRTTSLKNARSMETLLIAYADEVSASSFELHNIAAGRNGRFSQWATEYIVYLALARKYARIRG